MTGKYEESARGIAIDLLRGATAEVVGEQYITGLTPQYAEIDGVTVQLQPPEKKEAAGVRVTYPDGFTALYLSVNAERAKALLAHAREIVEEHRA